MRSLCLVGAGTISKVYTDVLANQGYDLWYVDPKFSGRSDALTSHCFTSVAEMPREIARAIDFWIVSTPTAVHADSVFAVLERNPAARILVEKPLVPPAHFERLSSLAHDFPECRILENCQYEQSSLVDRLLSLVPEIIDRREEIRGLYVEFTKNRVQDDRQGRFRDHDHLLVGYEGPHLIAIADAFTRRLFGSSVLDDRASVRCVDKNVPNPAEPDEGTVRFALEAPGAPPVHLYTSMIGEVGENAVMPSRYSEIRRKWIFLRDRERYRILRVDFDDSSLIIRFDPQKFVGESLLRNVQIVYRKRGEEITNLASLQLNIFADGVLANLRKLDGPAFDTAAELEISRRKSRLLDHLAGLYRSTKERAMSPDERRQSWRVEAPCHAVIVVEGTEYECHVTDLNESGFQFECLEPLPVGAALRFRMIAEGKTVEYAGHGVLRWARHFNFQNEGLYCYGAVVHQWSGTTGSAVVETLLAG